MEECGKNGFQIFPRELYAMRLIQNVCIKAQRIWDSERLFILEYIIEDLFLCMRSIGANLSFPQNDDSLRNA